MNRIVLLGGGYVTLHAYANLVRRLGRAVRRGDLEIVVISADRAHRFHGFTGELLAGMVDRDRLATPLDEAMPLARIIIGRAVDIDADRRRVSYRSGDDATVETLRYDHLVVGTGAKEPTAEVAGLRRHGFTLRGPDEIGVARRPPGEPCPGSPVVVAGGGVAGVELAAAIADRGHPVTLVHSAARVLGEWDDQPRLVARAEAELARLGVTVLTGRRVVEVTPVHRPAVGRRRARRAAPSWPRPGSAPCASPASTAGATTAAGCARVAPSRSPPGCGRRATRRGSRIP